LTSLLRKAASDLTLKRIPTAFADLEAFKGHAYPDVSLSILILAFRELDKWLATAGLSANADRAWWRKWWGGQPERPPLDKKKLEDVRRRLQEEIGFLTNLLHSEDEAELVQRVGTTETAGSHKLTSASAKTGMSADGGTAKLNASAEAKLENQVSKEGKREAEQTETTKRNKLNILHRKIIDFQNLFASIVELSGNDAFIFLDDLYHLRRADQPHVLDYFHRIVKGRSVWLKIGTIRHRTDWYHHGDPPVGMKLGDDCDDIDLDITLAKYEIARKFLLQVLDEIISEAGIKGHTAIMADGGVVRLVLAKVSAAPAPCFWMASRHSRVRRRSLRQRIGKWRRSRDSAVRRSLRLFSEPSSTNRLHNAATASTA
jgi:hypothetical protein